MLAIIEIRTMANLLDYGELIDGSLWEVVILAMDNLDWDLEVCLLRIFGFV